MENRRVLVIFAIVLAIISGLTIWYLISKRVPMNDEFTVGNNPGNLYNDGLFLELDGKIYFSNPLDNDCLYSMTPDENDLVPLTVMAVNHIVGAGKYLYFNLDYSKTSQDSGISGLGKVSTFYGLYRADLKGENQAILDRETISSLQLVGSNVYYTVTSGQEPGLHKIRVDGKMDELVTSEQINPSCALDGLIYYSGVDLDHNLHSMDTLDTDAAGNVLDGNIWQPIIKDGMVYYIDAEHNYRLCRTNLSTHSTEVLTDRRVDFYNMNDYNIFFSTSVGEAALFVMNLDGSGETVIAEGIYHSLNLTSRYLYFKPYDVDNVLYHVPVDGSEPVSTFLPYMKNNK